jgi:hypothetical protein
MNSGNRGSVGLSLAGIGGEMDLINVGRPVARAASLRTGRGTGLKRLDDVEDMAKTFRKTIASERTILMTCAPTPEDERNGGHDRTAEATSTVVGGDARRKLRSGSLSRGGQKEQGGTRDRAETGEEDVVEGKRSSAAQRSKTFGRSKRQHRSLKAALEYSRKGEDTRALEGKSGGGRSSLDESTGANDCNDGTVLSPTNSEYSRSTVTDASPSPNGSEGTSSARMLEEISSARGHRNKDKEKEEAAVSQIRTDSQVQNSGWSSRPSSAAQSRGRTGGPNSSSTARRKKGRRGFGAFRVPKGAKHFVHSTLDAAEGSIEGEEMGKERKVV